VFYFELLLLTFVVYSDLFIAFLTAGLPNSMQTVICDIKLNRSEACKAELQMQIHSNK